MFGSGLCIFSKHPIIETFQRRYSLNGYAHRFQHGDWFGGKSVGLAQVLVQDFRVNFYVTHVSYFLNPLGYGIQQESITEEYPTTVLLID